MQKTIVMAVAVCAATACGPASVNGTFDGAALSASDAVSLVTGGTVSIVISSLSGLCGDTDLAFVANASSVTIGLGNQGGDVEAGEYSVASLEDVTNGTTVESKFAFVTIGRAGDTCGDEVKAGLGDTGGTVTLDSVDLGDSGSIAGSFAVTVDGEDITGTFNAPICTDFADSEECTE